MMRWMAVLLTAMTMTACTGQDVRSAGPTTPPTAVNDDGPVIALTEGSAEWPAAEVIGQLTERQGCLLIDDAIAVFPLGTDWTPPSATFPNGESVPVNTQVRAGRRVV